jgi:hypothetical protein
MSLSATTARNEAIQLPCFVQIKVFVFWRVIQYINIFAVLVSCRLFYRIYDIDATSKIMSRDTGEAREKDKTPDQLSENTLAL